MRAFIAGPAGRLETILWRPNEERAPRSAAVVCHPHPLGGGTMDNNVVFRIARGLRSAGTAVLRFNFRGVGQSEGRHHGEGGEEEDLAAALDHLEREVPGVPLWAGGFSFGARTAASRVRKEARVRRVFLVAVPSKAIDCRFVRELAQPTYVLLAGEDEFGTPADFRQRIGPLGPNFEVEVIEGVDHFFRGRTPEVEERLRAWAERSPSTT
jgi:alpha/beta superfamily hydrolase